MTRGRLVTVGEAMVCITPDSQVPFGSAATFHAFPGGAEYNACMAITRLGAAAWFATRLGNDGPGLMLQETLATQGVDGLSELDPRHPTGIYVREWLPDGLRRVTYYRQNSSTAMAGADAFRLPEMTSEDVALLTGITLALGAGPRGACERLLADSRNAGATVAFDPNYRPALWDSEAVARADLSAFVERVDILLLSEDDSALLYGSTDPEVVLPAALAQGPRVVGFKRGARGASIATSDGARFDVPPERVSGAVDPVGAGDGFNAGFIAALLAGAEVGAAGRLGGYVGARAVETVGDTTGYPHRAELPSDLRSLLTVPSQPTHVIS